MPYYTDHPDEFKTAVAAAVASHQALPAPPGHTTTVESVNEATMGGKELTGEYTWKADNDKITQERIVLVTPAIMQEAQRRGVPYETMRQHVLCHERLHEWGLMNEARVEEIANQIIPI